MAVSCAHLGGLGLLLAYGADDGHQGHVNVAEVLLAHAPLELPHGLDERTVLDVSDCHHSFAPVNQWP